jgi:hypothetical protein
MKALPFQVKAFPIIELNQGVNSAFRIKHITLEGGFKGLIDLLYFRLSLL